MNSLNDIHSNYIKRCREISNNNGEKISVKDLLDRNWLSINKVDIMPECFLKPNNRNVDLSNKPYNGLWASTYLVDGDVKSDWHRFLLDNMRENIQTDAIIFKLKENVNICIINSYDTLAKVTEKYKLNKEDNEELNVLMKSEFYINKSFIDYEKLSEDYDGLYVSKQAIIETKHPFAKYSLNTWDVETLLLGNLECIDNYRKTKLNI